MPDVVHEPDEAAAAIRAFCREHPELKKDEYQTADPESLDGHCYAASEAYYHARGCELDVYCLSWGNGRTHWYLADGDTYIDLTADPSADIPYEEGTRRGFLTGDDPSERAQRILDGAGVMES